MRIKFYLLFLCTFLTVNIQPMEFALDLISSGIDAYLNHKNRKQSEELLEFANHYYVKYQRQKYWQDTFYQTLPSRLVISLGLDALVRNYLPTRSTDLKSVTSFLLQAGIGYALYDHWIAPRILELSDEHNTICWNQQAGIKALLYALKVGCIYLSTQRINDGIARLVHKIRRPSKDESVADQKIELTNDHEIQQDALQ